MTEQVRDIAIEDLVISELNPRHDQKDLTELTESIRVSGVLEPILVMPVAGNGHFAIVAGSRRFAASKLAGKTTVPAIVREMSDDEAEIVSLIENLQREDLNAIEEAQGYAKWLEIQGKAGRKVTHDDLAKAVGKKRSTISNALRLLEAPEPVRKAVEKGEITGAHARVAMSVPKEMLPALKFSKDITVTELEDQAHDLNVAGAAIAELRGRIDDAKAKGFEITWPTGKVWMESVQLELSEILGKAPKAIAGSISDTISLNQPPWSVRGSVDVHDKLCACRASAPRRNRPDELERVCVSPTGWRKYRAALMKGTKTKTGAVKKKVASAAAKDAKAKRELKVNVSEATKALAGKSMGYTSLNLGHAEQFLFKRAGDEAQRLALFGIVSKYSQNARGNAWRIELWKQIAALPIKDVRVRALRWAVAIGQREISDDRNARALRTLVNAHYAPKSKKKAAR